MERKLATVLFVDLVDSTGLVAGAAIPRSCAGACRSSSTRSHKCIEGHGGNVEKFAGDAVMAAFGIPQAHQDDAERAVKAALAILDSVDLGSGKDRRRIGRGRLRRTDSTFATGEAVNLAAGSNRRPSRDRCSSGQATHG